MAHNIYNNLAVRMTGGTLANPQLELFEGTDGALSIVIDSDSQVNYFHSGSGLGSQRVAMGKTVSVSGSSAIGIGNGAQSWGSSSTAVGNGASAELSFTTAIGGGAIVERQNGTAIGYNAKVDTAGNHQVAIGYTSHAANWDTVAIGRNTHATGNGSMVLGHSTSSLTNSTGNSLALGWDDGSISFLFNKGGDSYLNGGQVGIGITTPSATLHLVGAGSTSATFPLFIENSSGNDLLKIDDGGNVVFNENGLDANFRIEGDTEPNLFLVDAGNNNIGISAAGAASTKFHIDTINESSKTTIMNLATNVSAKGIVLSVGSSLAHTYGVQSTSNGSGGFNSYAIWGSSQASTTANNYGGYFNARNATTNSYGVFALSNAGNSTNTYGIYASDNSSSSNKNAGYFATAGGVTGGTAYGLRTLVGTSFADNTLYGIRSAVSVAVGFTGQTTYAGYFESQTNGSAGSVEYGIVVPFTDNNSGFGTATPETTVDINGDLSYRWTSPSTMSTSEDNYSAEGTSAIRLDPDGAAGTTITGFSGVTNGKELTIVNIGVGVDITITNQDASSIAANRVINGNGGASLVLSENDTALYKYDDTTARWRLISNT